MDQLDKYFEQQQEIYDYFGYVEDWVVIPIGDSREYFWRIVGGEEHGGEVHFANSVEELTRDDDGHYY